MQSSGWHSANRCRGMRSQASSRWNARPSVGRCHSSVVVYSELTHKLKLCRPFLTPPGPRVWCRVHSPNVIRPCVRFNIHCNRESSRAHPAKTTDVHFLMNSPVCRAQSYWGSHISPIGTKFVIAVSTGLCASVPPLSDVASMLHTVFRYDIFMSNLWLSIILLGLTKNETNRGFC